MRHATNCRVYRSVSDGFESDHRIVVMDCIFPSRNELKRMSMKKINKRPLLDITTLGKNPEVMNRHSNRVEQTLTDIC